MNTNYKKVPTLPEIEKIVGIYNLTATVEEDKETLSIFKNVPGLIAFICTLKKEDVVIGIGRGTATLNRMSKYVDRAVCYAFNASLIDAMVRSTKTLDAIYLNTTSKENYPSTKEILPEEIDEGRDKKAYFANDDDLKYMSDKQKSFLTKLISKKCNGTKREDYLSQIKSPYFSSVAASVLIKTLLSSNNY